MLHVNKSGKCCVEVNLKLREQLLIISLFNRQCKEYSSTTVDVWKRYFLLSYSPIKTIFVNIHLKFFHSFYSQGNQDISIKNLFKVSKYMFDFKLFSRFQTFYLTGTWYFIFYLDFPQSDLDLYQRFFKTNQHFVSLKEIDIIRRMFSCLLVAILRAQLYSKIDCPKHAPHGMVTYIQ